MSRRNRDRRVRNRLATAARGSCGTPSVVARDPLPLSERPPSPWHQARFINAENTYLRVYSLGECSVLVTRERGKWHLSIANPDRDPTWGEIAEARCRLLPGDITAAMLLPPLAEYVNVHDRCFQVVEVVEIDPAAVPTAEVSGP
jgi:hypothetical protein